MRSSLRVHGIYDLRTLGPLKETKVHHWVFDLRPKSLNYIPSYKLEEILQKEGMYADSVTLHFANEKDFIISKVIQDLMKAYPQLEGRLFLEFSDQELPTFYESFDLPFFWHYQSVKNTREILASPKLKGLIFESDFLDEILGSDVERNFLMNLFSFNPTLVSRPIEFILNVSERTSFSRTFFEFLDFTMISLVLGPEMEVCYRNIDLNLLGQKIKNLKDKEKQHAHSAFQ